MNWHLIRDSGHRNRMTEAELDFRMSGWLAGEYEAVIFEDDTGPMGYVLYRTEPEYVHVRQFYVGLENRRQGTGRAAMAWLREHAWGSESRLRVEVLVCNEAGVGFWRAMGFVEYSLTLELDR